MDSFQLTSSRAVARIDLLAGRLGSLIVDDMELLVTEGIKPTRWGSFPMVPWCGRLDHGLLTFDGVEHQFPPTSGVHANHGTAMHQTWTQTSDNEIKTDLGKHWKFGGTVFQRFEVADDAFTVHMTVIAGEVAMPAPANNGAGYHGPVQWRFFGPLTAGAEGDVSFQIRIE